MIPVTVTEASQVAEARRRAVTMAESHGFGETAAGRVAIVTTELATNIVKYGVPGEILVGTYEDTTGMGIQVLALDKGPGLGDPVHALRDGHSTGGSRGMGLGAVKRLSDAFDVVSWPGKGTAVTARLSADRAYPQPSTLPGFGAVAVPLRGEIANGDAYAVHERPDGWTVIVADGLGHGPIAAQASQEAVRLFRKHQDERPGEILAAVHGGMRQTRGGAVSVARYDRHRSQLTFAGIGNVAGAVVSRGETKRTVSLAGTAGHVARRIQEFDYPLDSAGLFVLSSDGIVTNWSLEAYPGLAAAHPSLVAGVIYRDFARIRDDATVLVVRGEVP